MSVTNQNIEPEPHDYDTDDELEELLNDVNTRWNRSPHSRLELEREIQINKEHARRNTIRRTVGRTKPSLVKNFR